MNYETTLFNQLNALVASDESFYSKDLEKDGAKYRVFSYRLASWSSFQKDSALECRGILFNIDHPAYPKLASLPPAKFFNVEEGNGEEFHIGTTVRTKMDKLDGSLISTYKTPTGFDLKSKTSLFSEQAVAAMAWLRERPELYKSVARCVEADFTLSFEYTSPANRIVVGYHETNLTLLQMRNHDNGDTYVGRDLYNALNVPFYDPLRNIMVKAEYPTAMPYTLDFVNEIRKETEGEGYVVELMTETGKSYFVKIKNEKYITLHRTKDSITSEKRLFECVLDEATDDLRSMFAHDEFCLGLIKQMEDKVIPKFNHMISVVESFYAENKGLDRKDYAIKAKTEQPVLMGLIMALYVGRDPAYKDFAKKNRKEYFGVGDATFAKDD